MTEVLEPNTLERWQREPISFITQVLRNPKGGKPFELFDAQLRWFEHCWQMQDDGRLKYPEQVLSWIKKTGKTTTAAMQMLTTLLVFGGRHAQGFCIASDLQQAQERVFADVKQIIEASPLLKPEAVITQSRITFPQTNGFIQAIGADSAGAAGVRPCFISVDEAHTITTERARRLFDEMIPITLGETQKISCRLVTSHAGFDESTLLRELYDKGMRLPEIKPGLRGGNSMLFTWRHECLSPWQTEAWLAEQRELTRPIQYQRQFENCFVSNASCYIDAPMFDRCVKDLPPLSGRLIIYVAVDAGWKRDNAAIVAVTIDGDCELKCNALTPLAVTVIVSFGAMLVEMLRNKTLSLSDHQLRQIHAAAKALLPLQRSDFVHGVKRRLAITHPTKPCRLRSVPNWHSITSPPPAHEIAHGSRALASERHPALSRAVS